MKKNAFLAFAVLAAAAFASAWSPARTEPTAEPVDATKWSYCAYFLPDGNTQKSYCTKAPLDQAQKECDARLKTQKIEGTCACTDDASFIGDRCK